jgi:hypothetical protein
MFQSLLKASAAAAILALVAGFAPANATPLMLGHGLVSDPSAVTAVRYKRYYSYPNSVYLQDGYSWRHDAEAGSYEYRELQRLFPETNWPPSLRYYER